MINAGLSIVPEGGKRYWVGTAKKWNYDHERVEEALGLNLETKLRALIGCDLKIFSAAAPIRQKK
ncbi:MAG: hypothetical protein EA362_07515 [Saprospirales bacterium]|nr:MAG: hypothetical protein EA362_07515 [Saprospirales bacterium]